MLFRQISNLICIEDHIKYRNNNSIYIRMKKFEVVDIVEMYNEFTSIYFLQVIDPDTNEKSQFLYDFDELKKYFTKNKKVIRRLKLEKIKKVVQF